MTTISLFLHSTGTGPFIWAAAAPEAILGAKVAPSHVGYPPNELLARGQSCSARDDAALVLKAIPDDAHAIHLFAHSYGGVVAFDLLTRLRGRVRSMFLYEPVLFGALAGDASPDLELDPDAIADARAMFDHPWFLTDDAKGGTDPWLEIFIDYWNKPGSWARMPEHIQSYARMTGWKMYQEVRACFFGVDSFAGLDFGGVPTTLVMGERSPRASRAMVRALAKRNPAARIVELANAGHMAPLTHPLLLNGPLIDHVRGLATP